MKPQCARCHGTNVIADIEVMDFEITEDGRWKAIGEPVVANAYCEDCGDELNYDEVIGI